MDGHPPISAKRYYTRFFRKVIWWPFLIADILSGGVSIVTGAWARENQNVADLAWKIPLAFFAIIVVIQFIFVPFLLHREDRRDSDAKLDKLAAIAQRKVNKISQERDDLCAARNIQDQLSDFLSSGRNLLTRLQGGLEELDAEVLSWVNDLVQVVRENLGSAYVERLNSFAGILSYGKGEGSHKYWQHIQQVECRLRRIHEFLQELPAPSLRD